MANRLIVRTLDPWAQLTAARENLKMLSIVAASTTVDTSRPAGFEASSEWTAGYTDDNLILSGGADQIFAVQGVDPATAAEICGLWSGGAQPTSRRGLEIAAQMADLGIVRRTLAAAVPFRIAVTGSSELSTAIQTILANRLGARITGDEADLSIFVRTGGRLVDLYPDGLLPSSPHVLIDAAYHHTFSIGPLVVPGDTACLACLAGRVGHRWGDPPAPQRPSVQRNVALLAEIASLEVGRIAAGDLSLAGKTVAYDFERRRVITGSVYKLPWCPVCGEGGEPDGKIDIPRGTDS